MPAFFWYAIGSSRQARAADGYVALSLLREEGNVFWTRTVWTSNAAMRAFMLAGSHRAAMPKLQHWCDEAAVAHWTQDSPAEPSWQEAWRRLVASGRASKVNHPSEAHRKFEVPAPKAK